MSIWSRIKGEDDMSEADSESFKQEEAKKEFDRKVWEAKQAINRGAQNAMGGFVGSGPLTGLGNNIIGGRYIHSGTAQTQIKDPYLSQIEQENHRLKWELAAQQSIRKQDSALIQRHYRMWAWLKDAHPEVMTEFESVEALLKSAGEEF